MSATKMDKKISRDMMGEYYAQYNTLLRYECVEYAREKNLLITGAETYIRTKREYQLEDLLLPDIEQTKGSPHIYCGEENKDLLVPAWLSIHYADAPSNLGEMKVERIYVDDVEFCKSFRYSRHIRCINGVFYKDGKTISDHDVKQLIRKSITPFISTEIPKKIDSIIKELIAEQEEKPKKRNVIRLSEVEYEEPQFLWYPYIPKGALSLLMADPGTGKTSFACYIAAQVTVGGKLFDQQVEQGNVLILSYEDEPSFFMRAIQEDGGDANNVFTIDTTSMVGKNGDEYDTSPVLCGDAIIEEIITENNIKLAIFDPLTEFFGGKVDMNRANQTHEMLMKLRDVAKRTGCSMLLISHMNKNASMDSMYRALGSIDIIGNVRSALKFMPNPNIENDVIAFHFKCNCAPKGKSIVYSIGDHRKVTLKELSNMTENDLRKATILKDAEFDYDTDPLVYMIRKFATANLADTRIRIDDFASLCYNETEIGCCKPWESSQNLRTMLDSIGKKLYSTDGIIAYIEKARPSAYYAWNGETRSPETASAAFCIVIKHKHLPSIFQIDIPQ